MAEQDERQQGNGSRDGKLSVRELTLLAKETVEDLTGLPAETVSGMEWDGDSWDVSVEVLELEKIPNTTDVMATYVVELDDNGNLLGFKRTRRYHRGQVEED